MSIFEKVTSKEHKAISEKIDELIYMFSEMKTNLPLDDENKVEDVTNKLDEAKRIINILSGKLLVFNFLILKFNIEHKEKYQE